MIKPEKQKALEAKMKKLGIDESALKENFILPSSKGGQKSDKNRCAVYLKHKPTSIEIKCAESRNRQDNRFFARRLLAEKIEEKSTGKSARLKKIEKLRRQKDRRKRRSRSRPAGGQRKKISG